MNDLISRQAVIDIIEDITSKWLRGDIEIMYAPLKKAIKSLPSVDLNSKPISYGDCCDALLLMWMDNVLTDKEYKRIQDKLNSFEVARRKE